MLVFVGLGYSTRHLTLEAVEELKSADVIYIDVYTSIYEDPLTKIIELNPDAEVIIARRKDLEGASAREVIEKARRGKVVIAVPGDPFIATTHDAVLADALRQGIEVRIVNGISIVTMAFSRLGLQSYRFGKHVTLVYPTHFRPYSSIEVIYDNLKRGLHTLVLLDLRVEERKAMTIQEAVDVLLELDYLNVLKDQLALGVARLGWRDEKVCVDVLPGLKLKKFPPPPHSVVVLARLDPVEEELIKYWKEC
ncbi:MAG: diphthine synthase [Desulfurococcaceae archaeon]